MGQYYRLSVLNSPKKTSSNVDKVIATMSPYDYFNGAKLMEFSYIGNAYVGAFETLINKENGKYAGLPVVCAGDYADNEPYTWKKKYVNIYELSEQSKNKLKTIKPNSYRYIINETKGLFFDTDKVRGDGSKYNLRINPLPLLISEGNGRGGGDYHGNGMEYVGAWARNVVVTSDNRPDEKEYKEFFVDFFEER